MKFERVYSAETRSENGEGVWTRNLYNVSVGSGGTGFCVGSAQVLRTVDYGMTWTNLWSTQRRLPYSEAHRIWCNSSNECWIPSFISNEVCYTRDLGDSWEILRLSTGEVADDIYFYDSKDGWIGVYQPRDSEVNGRLLRTTDAGHSWFTLPLKIQGRPYRLSFPNERIGWAFVYSEVSAANRLLRSLDGGLTWKEIHTFRERYLDLHALDGNEIFVFGASEAILKSEDAGLNWEAVLVHDSAINGVLFNGPNAIAVGDRGALFISSDKGKTWESVETDTRENLVAIDVFENGIILVVSSYSIFRLDFKGFVRMSL